MDRFVIRTDRRENGKSNTPCTTTSNTNKRKSQAEKDKAYDKKRKREFQAHWLTDFPWLRKDCKADAAEIAFCHVCRACPECADKQSGLFIGTNVVRRDTLTSHQLSAKHVVCDSTLAQRNKVKKRGDLDKAFLKIQSSELERYHHLFNTAYALAKHNRPFSDFSFLCEIQIKNGLKLGNDHLNRDACTGFISAIATTLHNDLREHVKRVRFVSIMSDSSTDASVIDQEAILLRYINPDNFEISTSFVSIEQLENAKSEGVFNAITSGLGKAGINLENADESSKLICVNMDGAAVNMGAKNGVAKKLTDCVDHPVIVTHCVAHKLELGILDSVKEVEYLKKFEDTLKRVCKFYSYSPKRRNELKRLADVFNETLLMHTDIKSIRWVSSKVRALRAVCVNLHLTVSHMEQVLNESNRADEQGQARAILNELTQVKFVKYIHLMLDVLLAVSATSKLFQTKDLVLFEVKEGIDALLGTIEALNQSPGENLQSFYDKYDSEDKMFDGQIKLKGTLSNFDDDTDIHNLLRKMGQYVQKRFADLKCKPLSDFGVMDFRLWPHSLAELGIHGNTEIRSLCEAFKNVLTEEEISKIPEQWQMLKVKVSLQRLTPPLVVYKELLQRNEESVTAVNTLVEILLTVSPSSAACERVFSTMNIVKNPQRSCLSQENLQNQMRIVADGPSVSEFEPSKSVQQWLQSSNRHIVHKQPSKPAVKDIAQPSTSGTVSADANESVEGMVKQVVHALGGADAATQRLKSAMADTDKPDGSCLLM